jgi:hypothetical protein
MPSHVDDTPRRGKPLIEAMHAWLTEQINRISGRCGLAQAMRSITGPGGYSFWKMAAAAIGTTENKPGQQSLLCQAAIDPLLRPDLSVPKPAGEVAVKDAQRALRLRGVKRP